MDPKFQTSFIPKGPVVSDSKNIEPPIHSVNIFSSVATTIFVLTILLVGGIFGYKIMLNNQIKNADNEIIKAKQSFEIDSVKNIIDVSSKISSTQGLLNRHIAVSELFNLLQNIIFKKVSLSNFKYENTENGIVINMNIEAQGYNALAGQFDEISKNNLITNPKLSDFELQDNGNIKAKFTAMINPDMVSYKKSIEGQTNQN